METISFFAQLNIPQLISKFNPKIVLKLFFYVLYIFFACFCAI